jgi:hypothetical protein
MRKCGCLHGGNSDSLSVCTEFTEAYRCLILRRTELIEDSVLHSQETLQIKKMKRQENHGNP